MAPDRPDASDVDPSVGAPDTGPVVTRVFGFCDAFSMKEEDGGGGGGGGGAAVDDHHHHEQFVEETTVGHDEEIVIEEEEIPMIPKPEPGDEKPGSGQSDDDLTSLSWLHQQNLLKGLEITDHPVKTLKEENILNNNIICEDSLDISENTNSVSSLDESYSPESNGKNGSVGSGHFLNYEDVVINGVQSPTKNTQESAKSPNGTPVAQTNNQANNNNNNNSNNSANFNLPVPNRNKHPTHIPYDPYLHKNSKPPYSFSCLIFMAIEDSPVKALPVKEVYAWILEHFPYFRNAPTGWKNSVRHNLSLNKCFRKVEKSPNLGKGSLWMVDAQYRPNLIQALSRSPFPPPTAANITAGANGATGATSAEKQPRTKPNGRLPDPRLFPYLARRLATTNAGENAEVEFDSDVDAAAAAMLSFKHGPIILNHHKDAKKKESNKLVPVITRSSTEDHTYSLITSVRLERRYAAAETTEDVDEQRKIAEGADALLNLAGVSTMPLSRDPLAPDEDEVVEHIHGNENPLFNQYWQPEAPYIPGSDPLEIRPVTKRRTSASSGEGAASKRSRKRPWRDTWAENGGRFIKQVRG